MPTPTYIALATTTLALPDAEVVFSSIPGTYRDLILLIDGASITTDTVGVRFNGDTGNNYNSVMMQGDGSSATSSSWTSVSQAYFGVMSDSRTNAILQFMDYSATDKHKTFLARQNTAAARTRAHASRWANTAAITSITLGHFNPVTTFSAGTTFSLYGVAA
jgi:hypothetical protein